jgi:hypothetical protein
MAIRELDLQIRETLVSAERLILRVMYPFHVVPETPLFPVLCVLSKYEYI